MNYVSGGKTIGFGHLGIAGLAAAKQPTFLHKIRACCAVYGAIDSSAAKQ